MEKPESEKLYRGISHISDTIIEAAGTTVAPKRAGILWLRRAGSLAAAFVAAVALLFAVNAAFPAFAEELPLVGGLFRYLNQDAKETDFNAPNLSMIAEHMAPVEDAETATLEGGMRFTVKEAYYDGMTLYCAAELVTALDPNKENTDWNYQISINGVPLDFDYTTHLRDCVKTGENTNVNDAMSTKIPTEFQPKTPGDIRVRIEAEFYRYGEEKTVYDTHSQPITELTPASLGKAAVEFTAKYDPVNAVKITTPAEQNGIKLLSFSSALASTSVTIEYPEEMRVYGDDGTNTADVGVALYLEDGTKVTPQMGEGRNGSAPNTLSYTQVCEGVPYGTKELTVKVHQQNFQKVFGRNTLVAEFLVDLEAGTVTPKD